MSYDEIVVKEKKDKKRNRVNCGYRANVEYFPKRIIRSDASLKEFNFAPSRSLRTQIALSKCCVSLLGLPVSRIHSLQVNIGIPAEDWFSIPERLRRKNEGFNYEAQLLMFALTFGFVSDSRIMRKKMPKVAQVIDKPGKTKAIRGREYVRAEYGFTDTCNLRTTGSYLQAIHPAIVDYIRLYEAGLNANAARAYVWAAQREKILSLFNINGDSVCLSEGSIVTLNNADTYRPVIDYRSSHQDVVRQARDIMAETFYLCSQSASSAIKNEAVNKNGILDMVVKKDGEILTFRHIVSGKKREFYVFHYYPEANEELFAGACIYSLKNNIPGLPFFGKQAVVNHGKGAFYEKELYLESDCQDELIFTPKPFAFRVNYQGRGIGKMLLLLAMVYAWRVDKTRTFIAKKLVSGETATVLLLLRNVGFDFKNDVASYAFNDKADIEDKLLTRLLIFVGGNPSAVGIGRGSLLSYMHDAGNIEFVSSSSREKGGRKDDGNLSSAVIDNDGKGLRLRKVSFIEAGKKALWAMLHAADNHMAVACYLAGGLAGLGTAYLIGRIKGGNNDKSSSCAVNKTTFPRDNLKTIYSPCANNHVFWGFSRACLVVGGLLLALIQPGAAYGQTIDSMQGGYSSDTLLSGCKSLSHDDSVELLKKELEYMRYYNNYLERAIDSLKSDKPNKHIKQENKHRNKSYKQHNKRAPAKSSSSISDPLPMPRPGKTFADVYRRHDEIARIWYVEPPDWNACCGKNIEGILEEIAAASKKILNDGQKQDLRNMVERLYAAAQTSIGPADLYRNTLVAYHAMAISAREEFGLSQFKQIIAAAFILRCDGASVRGIIEPLVVGGVLTGSDVDTIRKIVGLNGLIENEKIIFDFNEPACGKQAMVLREADRLWELSYHGLAWKTMIAGKPVTKESATREMLYIIKSYQDEYELYRKAGKDDSEFFTLNKSCFFLRTAVGRSLYLEYLEQRKSDMVEDMVIGYLPVKYSGSIIREALRRYESAGYMDRADYLRRIAGFSHILYGNDENAVFYSTHNRRIDYPTILIALNDNPDPAGSLIAAIEDLLQIKPVSLGAKVDRILFVDDDTVTTELFREWLLARHLTQFEVVPAISNRDAFYALKTMPEDFCVIILDYVFIGGLNGLQVLKVIKTIESIKDIPVIMVTGWKDTKAINRDIAIKAGAAAFLEKPYRMDDLIDLVRKFSADYRGNKPAGQADIPEFLVSSAIIKKLNSVKHAVYCNGVLIKELVERSSSSINLPAKYRRNAISGGSIALNAYLREIAGYKSLSYPEEANLAKRIRKGDPAALEELVNSNLLFVVSVARRYENQGMELVDLIAEGNKGLLKAAKRFDETKNFKFISYAVWWIRQAIIEALAGQSRIARLPPNKVSHIHRMTRQFEKKEQELMRQNLLPEEVLRGDDLETWGQIMAISNHMSLDASIGQDGGILYDIIPDAGSWHDEWAKRKYDDVIRISLAGSLLNSREKEVLSLYFGIGEEMAWTLEEIGHKFNITGERVKQIKTKALRRLKYSWQFKKEISRISGYPEYEAIGRSPRVFSFSGRRSEVLICDFIPGKSLINGTIIGGIQCYGIHERSLGVTIGSVHYRFSDCLRGTRMLSDDLLVGFKPYASNRAGEVTVFKRRISSNRFDSVGRVDLNKDNLPEGIVLSGSKPKLSFLKISRSQGKYDVIADVIKTVKRDTRRVAFGDTLYRYAGIFFKSINTVAQDLYGISLEKMVLTRGENKLLIEVIYNNGGKETGVKVAVVDIDELCRPAGINCGKDKTYYITALSRAVLGQGNMEYITVKRNSKSWLFKINKTAVRFTEYLNARKLSRDSICVLRYVKAGSKNNKIDICLKGGLFNPGAILNTIRLDEEGFLRCVSPKCSSIRLDDLISLQKRDAGNGVSSSAKLLHGAYDAVRLGIDKQMIYEHERIGRLIGVPCGIEIEFDESFARNPGDMKKIKSILPNYVEYRVFRELNLRPTFGHKTQLAIINQVLNDAGLDKKYVNSIQFNVGVPRGQYWHIPGFRKALNRNSLWLMFDVVAAFVTDERIAAKKTRKVVTCETKDVEPIENKRYVRLEYGFGDIVYLENIINSLYWGHACLQLHQYFESLRLYGGKKNSPEYRFASIGGDIESSLKKNSIISEAHVDIACAATYSGRLIDELAAEKEREWRQATMNNALLCLKGLAGAGYAFSARVAKDSIVNQTRIQVGMAESYNKRGLIDWRNHNKEKVEKIGALLNSLVEECEDIVLKAASPLRIRQGARSKAQNARKFGSFNDFADFLNKVWLDKIKNLFRMRQIIPALRSFIPTLFAPAAFSFTLRIPK